MQMKNAYLIEKKVGIFDKIKSFIKEFLKKEKQTTYKEKVVKQEKKESNNQKLNKEQFMELYQKVVNREVDCNTLDEETITKICELLKEEFLIRVKHIEDIKSD